MLKTKQVRPQRRLLGGVIIIIIIIIIISQDNIYDAIVVAQSDWESSPVHLMNADSAPDGCQHSDQAKQLGS